MPEGMPMPKGDGAGNGTEAGLLFLYAQTALHPGSGTTVGVVDLPVQRERHTQWPVVPAASLKGVLRDACRRRIEGKSGREADADPRVVVAFGPPTSEADKHAGALTVTDARILAFPVRSLRGVFAWVTAPAVIARLNRDLALASLAPAGSPPSPERERAACAEGSPLLVGDGQDKLVLEEFEFSRSGSADPVAGWIASNAVADEATRERLQRHLVLLHDDDFTHFVRHATEVVARVALEYERKTVRQGALFYQEFLPAETLFYAVVLASPSRRDDDGTSAAAILSYLKESLPRVLQLGGDETTGKGICFTGWIDGQAVGARP